jgi:hypothetical protein
MKKNAEGARTDVALGSSQGQNNPSNDVKERICN